MPRVGSNGTNGAGPSHMSQSSGESGCSPTGRAKPGMMFRRAASRTARTSPTWPFRMSSTHFL